MAARHLERAPVKADTPTGRHVGHALKRDVVDGDDEGGVTNGRYRQARCVNHVGFDVHEGTTEAMPRLVADAAVWGPEIDPRDLARYVRRTTTGRERDRPYPGSGQRAQE